MENFQSENGPRLGKGRKILHYCMQTAYFLEACSTANCYGGYIMECF